MSNATGVTLAYEKIAMAGGEMPDGLTYPDMLLFLGLRSLYSQYKQGIIGRPVATEEKRKLLKKYEYQKFLEESSKRWVEVIKKTEAAATEYRKNRTIENADKLLFAIDGIK